MQLDSAFEVKAPIDRVWSALMDFERVAACLPGAQVINTLSEDAYQVGMKVKLGPVTMQYKGQLEVVERVPDEHRAVLRGRAKEARGQGTAEATAQLALTSDGETTHGRVSADVNLSGRAAAMGQGVITTVTEQMMAQFATNLQAMLAADDAPADAASTVEGTAVVGGAEAAGAEQSAGDAPATTTAPAKKAAPRKRTAAKATGDVATANGAAVASAPVAADGGPTPRAAARPTPAFTPAATDDNALDAVALAKAIAEAQLREPKKALGLLAIVAVLAYLLGKRRGRRAATR